MSLALPEIRKKGWKALVEALGHAGATQFMLVYEKGKGNYTRERKQIFKGVTIESIIQQKRPKNRRSRRKKS
jgi:hypothetical protein